MTTRRILLGLEGSPGSRAALEWCRQYAGALDAEVIAVFVVDRGTSAGLPVAAIGQPLEEVHEAMAAALEGWVGPLRAHGILCRTLVLDGHAAAVLDDAAVEQDCELIVVGRRGRGGFPRLILGSVANALAHHSHRPLVVVPPDEEQ